VIAGGRVGLLQPELTHPRPNSTQQSSEQIGEEAVAATRSDGGEQTAPTMEPADHFRHARLDPGELRPRSRHTSRALTTHRRLTDRREIHGFAAELIDRFGTLPPKSRTCSRSSR
jgi:hypothetical protein